jgi:hypothetical protein
VEGSNDTQWNDSQAQTYVDDQRFKGFVDVHSVAQDSERHVLAASQELCIDRYARDYSFIMFLGLGEYMLLHDATEEDADLHTLLEEPAYRYSSGVNLCSMLLCLR